MPDSQAHDPLVVRVPGAGRSPRWSARGDACPPWTRAPDVPGPPPPHAPGPDSGSLVLPDVAGRLRSLQQVLPSTASPCRLSATLLQPNGTPAASVQVAILAPGARRPADRRLAMTGAGGEVVLALPAGGAVEADGLTLRVHGPSGGVDLRLAPEDVARGDLGPVVLPHTVEPMRLGIASQIVALRSATRGSGESVGAPAPGNASLAREPAPLEVDLDSSPDRFTLELFVPLNDPDPSDGTTVVLGYVVRIAQQWTPRGLSIGGVVHCLPLAPGERQEVAIVEHDDMQGESAGPADGNDAPHRAGLAGTGADPSPDGVFEAAVSAAVGHTWYAGGILGAAESHARGSGTLLLTRESAAPRNGSLPGWLEAHRERAARLLDAVHAGSQRAAEAQRRVFRTTIRVATGSEPRGVTTRTIANGSDTCALTLQYRSVRSAYHVTTDIDAVRLVAVVPVGLVPFLPPGAPPELDGTGHAGTRREVLARYRLILAHAATLAHALPRRYQHPLGLLRRIVVDPALEVADFAGGADRARLVEIEQLLQHLVRNAVPYSRVVWRSASAEERAVLLQDVTVTVSSGETRGVTETLPLLACVQNEVLGFVGDTMIMPLALPARVTGPLGVTGPEVEQALTRYYELGVCPPASTVTLPARGVLAEAVLGSSATAARMDLTRLWRWMDSPAGAP